MTGQQMTNLICGFNDASNPKSPKIRREERRRTRHPFDTYSVKVYCAEETNENGRESE